MIKLFENFKNIFSILLLECRDTENVILLNRPQILHRALSVVYDCIGEELYGLSLARNMIPSGDGLRCIRAFFPNLKFLDLSYNEVIRLFFSIGTVIYYIYLLNFSLVT